MMVWMGDKVSASVPEVALGWTRGSVPLHTHACFYYSDEASLKGTLAFLRAGLDAAGELNVIFADRSRHEELLSWLQEGYEGDVSEAIARGTLALVPGAPTKEQLLENIAATLDAGIAELLAFESEVNATVRAYPAVVICTYGVPTLSGKQLIDGGLLTHPVVFLNGNTLSESPLYVDPSPAAEVGKRAS